MLARHQRNDDVVDGSKDHDEDQPEYPTGQSPAERESLACFSIDNAQTHEPLRGRCSTNAVEHPAVGPQDDNAPAPQIADGGRYISSQDRDDPERNQQQDVENEGRSAIPPYRRSRLGTAAARNTLLHVSRLGASRGIASGIACFRPTWTTPAYGPARGSPD